MTILDCRSFLARLEQNAANIRTDDVYLWPRTPVSNMQAEIWTRVGHSDWGKQRGRPGIITRTLAQMVDEKLLRDDFTFLDICTGDGLIPWQVQRGFPLAGCHGVDINKGQLDAHVMVQRQGVHLWRIPIQDLFAADDVGRFDVVCMLNTYRGWTSADLRDGESQLPEQADRWLRAHARYIFVTTHDTQQQIDAGFWVRCLGNGEDNSTLVLMWPLGAV